MKSLPPNIAAYLEGRLQATQPALILNLLEQAREIAGKHACKLYLVGGLPRDLLLGIESYDVDLSIEVDAPALARALAGANGLEVEAHNLFGTATIKLGDGIPDLDFVTARKESYPFPGALPVVDAGTIWDDLARRDFTINALALDIQGDSWELLDPHGGIEDIKAGLIQVLHPASFRDDPTRIIRAVKLARRFGFKIEHGTLELILQAVRDGALSTISTDRAVRELLLAMGENEGGSILAALNELGVLGAIHSDLAWPYPEGHSITADLASLQPKERVRALLAILGAEHKYAPEEAKALAEQLGLPTQHARLMYGSARLMQIWKELGTKELKPSQVYNMLRPIDPGALEAYLTLTALSIDEPAWSYLQSYLKTLRYVKPELGGDYLRLVGVEPGPVYKELLAALHEAKLDRQVPGREDEERFVEEWLKERGIRD